MRVPGRLHPLGMISQLPWRQPWRYIDRPPAAARRVRAWEHDQGRARLPIVAVTSGVFEEDRRLCFDAGMDDFIAG